MNESGMEVGMLSRCLFAVVTAVVVIGCDKLGSSSSSAPAPAPETAAQTSPPPPATSYASASELAQLSDTAGQLKQKSLQLLARPTQQTAALKTFIDGPFVKLAGDEATLIRAISSLERTETERISKQYAQDVQDVATKDVAPFIERMSKFTVKTADFSERAIAFNDQMATAAQRADVTKDQFDIMVRQRVSLSAESGQLEDEVAVNEQEQARLCEALVVKIKQLGKAAEGRVTQRSK